MQVTGFVGRGRVTTVMLPCGLVTTAGGTRGRAGGGTTFGGSDGLPASGPLGGGGATTIGGRSGSFGLEIGGFGRCTGYGVGLTLGFGLDTGAVNGGTYIPAVATAGAAIDARSVATMLREANLGLMINLCFAPRR
jgi:hypothetical protein